MWRYPPPAFLVFWLLSLLPYLPACFLWLILTGYAFYRTVHYLIPRRLTALLFLSYAGFYQNWIQGQNAMFTGSLLCGGLLRSRNHPVQGGVLIGLLVYKPQFALLAMLFLLFRKEWKAFLTAGCSGAGFALLSLAAYGAKPWQDFLASLPMTQMAVEGGFDPIHKLITFFGALILAGVPGEIARVLHLVFMLLVVLNCCIFFLKCKNRMACAALAVCGTLLSTPYAYDYEFVIMAFPLAWLISHNLKEGWPVGEKTFCALAWIAPFLVPPLAYITHVQTGFVLLSVLFFLIWRKGTQLPER